MSVDQTNMILVPDKTDNTYDIKRAKYVFIHRKKDKRAFTMILLVDFGDKILPTQNIWKRVLATSLPTNKVSEEAIKKDHYFRLNRQINWSNLKTNQV